MKPVKKKMEKKTRKTENNKIQKIRNVTKIEVNLAIKHEHLTKISNQNL